MKYSISNAAFPIWKIERYNISDLAHALRDSKTSSEYENAQENVLSRIQYKNHACLFQVHDQNAREKTAAVVACNPIQQILQTVREEKIMRTCHKTI